MVMINKSLDSFVENAYQTINRSEETNTPKCHECNLKDQVISEFYELMYTNDTKDQPLSIAKNRVHPVANNEVPQKFLVAELVKNCFSVLNMKVLGLDMETRWG